METGALKKNRTDECMLVGCSMYQIQDRVNMLWKTPQRFAEAPN